MKKQKKLKKDRFQKAIADAKKVVASWGNEKRANVQLEGSPTYTAIAMQSSGKEGVRANRKHICAVLVTAPKALLRMIAPIQRVVRKQTTGVRVMTRKEMPKNWSFLDYSPITTKDQ